MAYITYTEAITMMPAAQFWGVSFFLMLMCLGIGSQYVIVETTVTAIIDESPKVGHHNSLFFLFITDQVDP